VNQLFMQKQNRTVQDFNGTANSEANYLGAAGLGSCLGLD